MIWRGKRHKCNIETWNEMGKLFMLIVAKLRHTIMNQMHIFKGLSMYVAIKVRNYERKFLYASNVSNISSTKIFLWFDQCFNFWTLIHDYMFAFNANIQLWVFANITLFVLSYVLSCTVSSFIITSEIWCQNDRFATSHLWICISAPFT